jgi:hypothetical protein
MLKLTALNKISIENIALAFCWIIDEEEKGFMRDIIKTVLMQIANNSYTSNLVYYLRARLEPTHM